VAQRLGMIVLHTQVARQERIQARLENI